MKAFPILIFFLFFKTIQAQEEFLGKYTNGLGETLILKHNNTFEYSWTHDLASSWNIGTWKIENKKYLSLHITEINDTLKVGNNTELVLSSDKISNTITSQDNALAQISGGGQSRNMPPQKLFISGKKLYTFSKEGKLLDKKLPSNVNPTIFTEPWFRKIRNPKIKRSPHEITGKIIGTISFPPHCGYIANAIVMKFEIIETNLKNYSGKVIPLIVKCPEFFEKNFLITQIPIK